MAGLFSAVHGRSTARLAALAALCVAPSFGCATPEKYDVAPEQTGNTGGQANGGAGAPAAQGGTNAVAGSSSSAGADSAAGAPSGGSTGLSGAPGVSGSANGGGGTGGTSAGGSSVGGTSAGGNGAAGMKNTAGSAGSAQAGAANGGSTGGNTPCAAAFAKSACLSMDVGTEVSSGGHNWTCNNANCRNCDNVSTCEPSATGCPWGAVWTDNGACK